MPCTRVEAWRWLRQMAWRTLCALALIITFAFLFLLGSLCLATDFLHADAPHEHHHDPRESDPNATLLDLCDFVLWTLTTVKLETAHFSFSVTLISDGFTLVPAFIPALRASTSYPIRAPPVFRA